MEGISCLLSIFSQSLINVFSLSGADTLDYFFAVFNGNNTKGTTEGAADAGVFGQAYRLFLYCAFAIIFLNMLYQIFKAFFGPLVQAESPSRVVLKSIFFGVLVALSQNIVAMVFEIAQIPFDAIYNDTLSSTWSPNFNVGNVAEAAESTIADIATASVFSGSFWISVICIVLFFMLLKNFMMLTLEMAERYLMLGLLTIVAPLCIACGAVRGLEDVFKNWLSWIINGCIVLIFTTFFLSVFIASFDASCDIPYLLLWICWFKAGQKLDEHMNALGLKTAKTGGFGLDVMNAMQAGLPTAIGLANKATGRNIPTSAKDIANGNWKPKGGFMGMSQTDRRVGNLGSGMAGAINKTFKKLEGNDKVGDKVKKANDALQKASQTASIVANKPKEIFGLSSGHGKNSGLTHEELQKYATGEKSINNLSGKNYQNVAKDLAEMKAGEKMAKAINDNNMTLSDVSFDKDGNMRFKATDDKGNMMTCAIAEHPADPKNMMQLTGADGETRGCIMKTDENPDAPLNLPFTGFDEKEKGDKQDIAGASDDTMVAAESIADANVSVNTDDANLSPEQKAFAEASEGNIPVSSENINEDGSLKKFDENGNEDVNGHFIKADNGTEEGMLMPESAIQAENPSDSNNARIANNATTADGQSASDYNQVAASTNEQISADNVNETVNPDNTKTTSITDGAGTEYNLSKNEDGSYTGTSKEGNTATFVDNGNGSFTKTSESREFDQSKGITTETSSENISSNNIASGRGGVPTQATDNNGVKYDLQDNGDGTFTGTNAAGGKAIFSQNSDGSMTKKESHSYATDMNGNKFEVNSSAVHDSAKDISGTSQNIDMSKEATRNGDGTVTATNEAGQQVTMPASSATTTCVDSATKSSFEIDGDKGFRASVNNNGQLQVGATNAETGNYQNVSGASVSVNGKDLDLSKSFESHDNGNGTITYSGQDKSGNKVSFTNDDLEKAHISAGETSLHTTKSADVMSQAGRTENTMNFRNENASVARDASAPVIVKSTEGDYFKAASSQRYDASGHASNSGEYMKTYTKDNIPSFVKVEQENGNIRSYKFAEGSNTMSFCDMKDNGIDFEPAKNINSTYDYRAVNENEKATHFNNKGVNYEMYDNKYYDTNRWSDSTGKNIEQASMPQHYVQIGDEKYAVDMQKATFSREGRVLPNENGEIPVKDYNGQSSTMINAANCVQHAEDKTKTPQVADYVKYKDPENGSAQYFKTNGNNIMETTRNDSYYNGVRQGMNLEKGRVYTDKDTEGVPTGRQIFEHEGEMYMLHPVGTNVSQCKNRGSWINLPNNQQCYIEPMNTNYMNRQLYNMGFDVNQNRYVEQKLNTNTSEYKMFAKAFGIPGNAKDVNISNNKNGVCVQYTSNGKKYAVTNLEASGFKPTETLNTKGKREPIGYKYEIPNNGKSPLPSIKNKEKLTLCRSSINRNDKKLKHDRKNNFS